MKNFDEWNEVKKKTDNEENRLYTIREIWWFRIGLNIGTEQNGNGKEYTRPCLIICGFGFHACMIVPLTTSPKQNRFRIRIGLVEEFEAKANISQIKVIDTKRLVRKVGFLDKKIFDNVIKNIKDLL